jgi:hypothetical protein
LFFDFYYLIFVLMRLRTSTLLYLIGRVSLPLFSHLLHYLLTNWISQSYLLVGRFSVGSCTALLTPATGECYDSGLPLRGPAWSVAHESSFLSWSCLHSRPFCMGTQACKCLVSSEATTTCNFKPVLKGWNTTPLDKKLARDISWDIWATWTPLVSSPKMAWTLFITLDQIWKRLLPLFLFKVECYLSQFKLAPSHQFKPCLCLCEEISSLVCMYILCVVKLSSDLWINMLFGLGYVITVPQTYPEGVRVL